MRILINVAMLLAYVTLVPVIGFFTATGVYLFSHMTYLGIRPYYLTGAVVIGGLLFLYTLFGFLLDVPIPHGVFY